MRRRRRRRIGVVGQTSGLSIKLKIDKIESPHCLERRLGNRDRNRYHAIIALGIAIGAFLRNFPECLNVSLCAPGSSGKRLHGSDVGRVRPDPRPQHHGRGGGGEDDGGLRG